MIKKMLRKRLNFDVTSRLPMLYVFFAGIGFSAQTLLTKILAKEGFHRSFENVFFRGAMQLLTSSIMLYSASSKESIEKPLFGDTPYVRKLVFLRSVLGVAALGFHYLSARFMPLGDATVIYMSSPVIAASLAYTFLGEPWRVPEFLATSLSMLGIVLIVQPDFLFNSSSTGIKDVEDTYLVGSFFAVLAAVLLGVIFIILRILGTTQKIPAFNIVFAQSLTQLIFSYPGSIIAGEDFDFRLTWRQFLLLCGSGLFGAISQIGLTIGVQQERSALVTSMRMSEALFSFAWQILFTGDSIAFHSFLGSILILIGVITLLTSKQ